jgi:transposase-like protein
LGYGTESVRLWVRQADIDEGHALRVSTSEAARLRELEQEVRELGDALVGALVGASCARRVRTIPTGAFFSCSE